MHDPTPLAAALIKCPSITPQEAGALDLLQAALAELGFDCTRLPFAAPDTAAVDNLFARRGAGAPHLCFAGHVDVVPAGDSAQWRHEPFGGKIENGTLFGRGAVDMKGAIAAFVAAVARFIDDTPRFDGTISFLITGDEEGPAINGTAKMLAHLQAQNISIDDCLVGEPTNPNTLGEMAKIGRRGSVNGTLTTQGAQGHVAYPDLACNPAPLLIHLTQALAALTLDDGTEHFQPSNLEITRLAIDNDATNVIPSSAQARFNIRYNDAWDRASIGAHIAAVLEAAHADYPPTKASYQLALDHTADCFLTEPGALAALLAQSVEAVTGTRPIFSTSGGTSDARFIKDYARVIEFGLVNQTAHKVDEAVPLAELEALCAIYTRFIAGYFSASA